jgi:hypothetical protein
VFFVDAGVSFDFGFLDLGGHFEDFAPDDMGGLSYKFLVSLRNLGSLTKAEARRRNEAVMSAMVFILLLPS